MTETNIRISQEDYEALSAARDAASEKVLLDWAAAHSYADRSIDELETAFRQAAYRQADEAACSRKDGREPGTLSDTFETSGDFEISREFGAMRAAASRLSAALKLPVGS